MSHILCKTKTKQLLSKVRTILYPRSREKCFPRVFITDGGTIWTLSKEGNFARSFPKLYTSFDPAIPLAKVYFTLICLHVWSNDCVTVLTVALFVKASQRFETPRIPLGSWQSKTWMSVVNKRETTVHPLKWLSSPKVTAKWKSQVNT